MSALLPAGNTVAPGSLQRAPLGEVPRHWQAPVCPNFSAWLPGDIVLVHKGHELKDELLSKGQLIALLARSKASYVHHEVTHAGIYIGDGRMIDAAQGAGVQELSVWRYAGTRALQVRRVRRLSDRERVEVASFAVSQVGRSYNMLALAVGEHREVRSGENLDSYYCSQLVLESVADAASMDLAEYARHRPFFPPMMVDHPALEAVDVHWWQCWGSNISAAMQLTF